MSESESKIDALIPRATWGRRRLRVARGSFGWHRSRWHRSPERCAYPGWRGHPVGHALAAAICAALVVALTGCSSVVAHRHRGPAAGDGPTWAGVLASSEPAGWEASRRDAALAPRAGDSDYPLDQWPRQPQPTIHRVRYLHIPRSPQTQIYTREERVIERGVTIWR